MGRVSQAQENRERIVDTASRLFREQDTHVSVADLMKAAGLTHGGFYLLILASAPAFTPGVKAISGLL
jgi:AcrR family transcriptional regulator